MFRLLVLTLCLVSTTLAANRPLRLVPKNGGRIIGGTDASISDYPWQVSLEYLGEHVCGASIIHPYYILTSTRCLYLKYITFITLRIGSSTRGSGGTVVNGFMGITHMDFNPETYINDVALVWIENELPLGTNAQAVKLAAKGYDPPGGLAVTVTGWGYTYTGGGESTTLQKVDISVIDRSSCPYNITDSMICAGQSGSSFCNYDYGGPLVNGNTQVGIASWGDLDCELGGAVYTNVGSYRDWISSYADV